MPPVGIEPTISADERSQTYTLDSAATGTGHKDVKNTKVKYIINSLKFYTEVLSLGHIVTNCCSNNIVKYVLVQKIN